jgi:riboflavin kinase/FMN adenylyltransferase
MLRFENYAQVPKDWPPCVVTIGSFDGLHLGHQHLISRVKEQAKATGQQSALLTFEPHPARVLANELSPPLLFTPERRRRALEGLGLDLLVLQRFDAQFASLGAEEFAREVLQRGLRTRQLVVGDDFTFGQNRRGRAEDLAGLGRELGFQVEVVRRVAVQGITVSSTRVRSFVMQGNVGGATLLLGRPYVLSGVVEKGFARGRKLGFPTANLRTRAELLPAPGVYVSQAWVEGDPASRPAATNVGVSPTFGPGEMRVEIHLLSPPGDLLGKRLAVAFLEHLRGEQVFGNVKALIAQMHKDIQACREYFEAHPGRTPPHPLDGLDV